MYWLFERGGGAFYLIILSKAMLLVGWSFI